MKRIILISIIITIYKINIAQKNIEFEKSNFPDRKEEFKEAYKQLKEGNKYFEADIPNYSEALKCYLFANSFNPHNALLNYRIGICYLMLKGAQKNKARPHFEEAIKLNPNVAPDIKYRLAQAYQLDYEFDKAIEMYKSYKTSLKPDELKKREKEINKRIFECENGKKLVANPIRVFIDNIQEINSKYPEYNPVISADESVMMFTSRRDNTTGGQKDPNDFNYMEDIYLTTRVGGKWTTPINPGKPLNSEDHDAVISMTNDGQKLIVYKGINGGDLYECKLMGDKWSKPEDLGKKINTEYHEAAASYAFDGKTLFFVSDKPGGYGGHDIYMITKNEKGKWGDPVNIGNVVNTEYDEDCIFLHPDGKTMYFSSRGHTSMGGLDIFKTTFENGKWTTPENIGYPINTPDDDAFFVISASGKHGYYSSSIAGGLGGQDIYLITFLGPEKQVINNNEDNLLASIAKPQSETVIEKPVEIKTMQLTLLKGIITDEKTSQPVYATIILTDNQKNEVIATFESNSKTGKYLVSLPAGRNYGIAVKAEGYLFHSENFDIPPTSSYQEVEKNIALKKIDVGNKIVLRNIFFDFNAATLRPESEMELDNLSKLLQENPTLKIEIGGHTDSKGSDEYNQKLSEARAKAVVDYLVNKKNIDPSRLQYKGYGEKEPIATNDTEEGRQLNRRTEFKIISK